MGVAPRGRDHLLLLTALLGPHSYLLIALQIFSIFSLLCLEVGEIFVFRIFCTKGSLLILLLEKILACFKVSVSDIEKN